MKTTWINKPQFKKMTWSHFWEYYKFHTIFGIFAVIIVVSIIYSIATNEPTDLTVHIIGNPTTEEYLAEDVFLDELNGKIKSVDGDDEIKIDAIVKSLAPYHLSADDQSGAMKIIEWDEKPKDADVMLIEKITVDLTAGEPALYIIDGDIMQVYMSQGVFAPLEVFGLKTNADTIVGESELDPGNTHIFGYSLKGNTLMEKMKLNTDNKYIAIRVINDIQKNNSDMAVNYDNAVVAFKEIMKYNPN